MTQKPALARRYRSELEEKLAGQLDAAGISYEYESMKLKFLVPARVAKYLPDFPITGTNILIEGKGHWGGFKGNKGVSAEKRQNMILLKEQHPEWDIRIVYDRASTKIYPGSPTTNAAWAETHGFKWADKGTIPQEWLDEITLQQKRKKT